MKFMTRFSSLPHGTLKLNGKKEEVKGWSKKWVRVTLALAAI